jgi:hypothetical protein
MSTSYLETTKLFTNNQKLQGKVHIANKGLFVGLLDYSFQAGNSAVSELYDHGAVWLGAAAEVPQKPEQLLWDLDLVTIGINHHILLRTLFK